MNKMLIHITLAAVLLVGTASLAAAAEVSGENVAMPKAMGSTELPNGMTYMTIGNSNVCKMNSADHPLNGAAGDCDGACLVDAQGKATCMGSCTWVDKDGDLALFTWDGQTGGNWKLVGGSGKYTKASGSGTWKQHGPFAGGMVRNTWQGEMNMK